MAALSDACCSSCGSTSRARMNKCGDEWGPLGGLRALATRADRIRTSRGCPTGLVIAPIYPLTRIAHRADDGVRVGAPLYLLAYYAATRERGGRVRWLATALAALGLARARRRCSTSASRSACGSAAFPCGDARAVPRAAAARRRRSPSRRSAARTTRRCPRTAPRRRADRRCGAAGCTSRCDRCATPSRS